ncbi:kelch repeat-containing protein [Parasphingorhabdus sp.]|uniref:Kelch repeat-containing protein n=1 Tax=Parasphingorhabdus sp. TaxID=2709688 RepID=UPI00326313D8
MRKFFLATALFILIVASGLTLLRMAMGWNDGMRETRSEIHATSLDDKLYVAGGIGLFRVLDSCEVLDLTTRDWASCGHLPRPLHHVAMAADDDHVYASGGYVALPFQADLEAGLFRFDTRTQDWFEISKLPHPIGQHAMLHFDGSLYIVGGQNDGQDLNTLWRYDISKDSWSAMEPMPTARHSHAIAVAGNQLYVTGGRSAALGTEITRIEVYDLMENIWERLPDMPIGRGGHGAVVHQNRLHIFGGESLREGMVLSNHDILDLITNKWTVGTPLKRPRHGFAFANTGGSGGVTVVGGGARPGMETIYSVTGDAQLVELK